MKGEKGGKVEIKSYRIGSIRMEQRGTDAVGYEGSGRAQNKLELIS